MQYLTLEKKLEKEFVPAEASLHELSGPTSGNSFSEGYGNICEGLKRIDSGQE
jgi:hypothetical protein